MIETQVEQFSETSDGGQLTAVILIVTVIPAVQEDRIVVDFVALDATVGGLSVLIAATT